MSGKSDFLKLATLDHVMGKAVYTAPANYFVGISSTLPADDGTNITEPAGGAYARKSTVAGDWNAATGLGPSPTLIDNLNIIQFVAATADWFGGSTFGFFFLSDAITAGNMLWSDALTTARSVLTDQRLEFDPGQLAVRYVEAP